MIRICNFAKKKNETFLYLIFKSCVNYHTIRFCYIKPYHPSVPKLLIKIKLMQALIFIFLCVTSDRFFMGHKGLYQFFEELQRSVKIKISDSVYYLLTIGIVRVKFLNYAISINSFLSYMVTQNS